MFGFSVIMPNMTAASSSHSSAHGEKARKDNFLTVDEQNTSPRMFPPTRWSLVAGACDAFTAVQLRALDELLSLYVPALKRFSVTSMRFSSDRAEDMVHGFVADKVIEQKLLRQADRSKGKFRSFLLRCFTNYVNSEQRKERAAKRGPPSSQILSIEEQAEEIPAAGSLRHDFDLIWARQVISAAIDRMRHECGEKNRNEIWRLFEIRVLGPALGDADAVPYERLVTEFRLKSPSQAANLLLTAKRMFRRIIEDIVRETVGNDDQVAEEIRDLHKILAGSDARS